jgi:TusA-related sulfurtransferase
MPEFCVACVVTARVGEADRSQGALIAIAADDKGTAEDPRQWCQHMSAVTRDERDAHATSIATPPHLHACDMVQQQQRVQPRPARVVLCASTAAVHESQS